MSVLAVRRAIENAPPAHKSATELEPRRIAQRREDARERLAALDDALHAGIALRSGLRGLTRRHGSAMFPNWPSQPSLFMLVCLPRELGPGVLR
jgi:hypothetical protein